MTLIRTTFCALALIGLAACSPDLGALGEPEVTRLSQTAPPGADPDACWGKEVTPAIIETVTDQVMLQPAEIMADGSVTRPAIYKTETRQAIVRERKEKWFRTPCAQDMTEELISSLQRALAIRGYYVWSVTGQMDARTRVAVRRYQEPQGLDSGILSIAAARQLGLVEVVTPASP